MEPGPQTERTHPAGNADTLESLLAKRQHASGSKALPEAAPDRSTRRAAEGIVIGRLIGLTEDGGFLVQFPGNPEEEPIRALAATEISQNRIGSPVALSFLEGNVLQPLILGFIQASAQEAAEASGQTIEVHRDGKRLVISAENELMLRCGDSTITLTKAGKVLIRGKYLLSRSSGPNRIKGGSVQIN